jgi:triacylglycerol lipase
MWNRRLGGVVAAVTLLAGALAPASASAAGTGPGGINDWSCKPGGAHPDPVVLVHGTGDNADTTWRALGPMLTQRGFCAFALTYGVLPGTTVGSVVGGLTTLDSSARELKSFVDKVLAATGAPKIDIVGYSQGSMLPTYYAKMLGGGPKINRYVSLSPGWNGTNLYGLAGLYGVLRTIGLGGVAGLFTKCQACTELLTGSETLKKLHKGGIFLPNITYTNIVTKYDEIVAPWTSGLGDGPNVTNVVLQESCPADHVNHVGMVVDPNALGHVINALDPAHAQPVPCTPMEPVSPRS